MDITQENEIELIPRTKENYTHDVLKDINIKEITAWKRTKSKLCYYIFCNILSCGFINIISKYKPLLFIKLYCISSIPEEADYFLIKDKYGEYKLCSKEIKRNKYISSNWEISEDLKEELIPGIISHNNKNITSQMIGFNYNSNFYEFCESTRKIIPVYFNLNNLTNKEIIKLFMDGLSEDKVKKYKERFGLNICPINHGLISIYFKKVELFLLIISGIVAILESILGNIGYCCIMIIFIIFIFIEHYIYLKKLPFNSELTLDGENIKIKVKRKNNNNSTNDYCLINNIDLLPGDVIYLEQGEIAPCDGIILEGKCFVDISSVNGVMAEKRKKQLENTNIKFDYQKNKNSIILHGSKIITSDSKLEKNAIILLCINTGNNSYKANQLENIYHLFQRNKKYKRIYSPICGKKFKLFLHSLGLITITTTTILLIYFFYIKKNNIIKTVKNLLLILIQAFCRCYLPTFHIINSFIIFIGNYYLSKKNIQTYDKSRLLISGFINTVFLDKTGTLTENSSDIKGFFPLCIFKNKTQLYLKCFLREEMNNLTSELIDYYSNYLKDLQNLTDNNEISYSKIEESQKFEEYSKSMTALFLECLLSCNSLEKINNKLFGISIEREIFSQIKWEMKISDEKSDYDINPKEKNLENEASLNHSKYSKYSIRVLHQKIEIFPNNYYQIMENNKNFNNKLYNNLNNVECTKDLIINSKIQINKNNGVNNIIEDILKNRKNNSYKLKIYKRFIKIGTLYSSAIVYNSLTKSLRFMTKGPIEDIIPNCDINFLPKDFYEITSLYRRNGYDLVVLASKIIDKYNYNDSLEEEFYMNNLIFCGLIILKNKLKKDVKQTVEKLKNLNCDLILSTGDNIYNALSVSFESGMISSKNIFVFDFNKNDKKIILSNFTEMKKIEQKYNIFKRNPSINNRDQGQIKNNIYSTNKLNAFINKLEKISLGLGSNKNLILENDKLSNKIGNNNSNINQKKLNSNKNIIFKKVPNLNLQFNDKKSNKKDNLIDSDRNSKIIFKKQITSEINSNQNSNHLLTGMGLLKESPRINLITKINKDKKPLLNFFSKIKGKKKRESVTSNKSKNNLNQKQTSTNNFKFKRNPTKNTTQSIQIIKPDFEYNSYKLKDMRSDCVYCVSGSALKFIYENRHKPEYKKYEFPVLLNHIQKFCKIYYEMKSEYKSFLIDYYRKLPNKITCMVGDGQNDIDAIMTSHVGININLPTNMNTVLCHFHPIDGSLLCIEKIIKYGRVIYENIYLFAVSIFYWTFNTICYICFAYFEEVKTDIYKLDFLSYCYFILSIIAFTIEPNLKAKNEPLFHNPIIFKNYFFTQSFILLVSIIIYNTLFIFLFKRNKTLESNHYKTIFITYYYFFNLFQMLSTQFSLNTIIFYRKENQNNYIYNLLIIILFCIFSFIICICGYSYHPLFIQNFDFEFSSKNIDSFDDLNKLISFSLFMANLLTSYLIIIIVFSIYKKKARAENERTEIKKNEKE